MDYQALIIGAGIAGSEAALVLAKRGLKIGLLTQSLDTVYLPFTPLFEQGPEGSLMAQVGAPGKKGWELHSKAKYILEAEPNIHLFQSSATGLIVENNHVKEVSCTGPSGPVRVFPTFRAQAAGESGE